jgi:NADP-dependent 3-hydroxy acid dehydrogenase YdfG
MNDRVVVITGASSGIGAELARLAAKQGAKVVLLARRKKELEAVAAACGPLALAIPTDVTKKAEVRAAFEEAKAKHGHVDAWVNNAGRGITRMPSQVTEDDIDEMMRVNVKSALFGVQAVLPHFQERGRGHLVNVSSMLGRVPFALARSVYSASKHFLNAFTANLRMELAATHPGIHVSLVSPGVVATDFGLNALHGGEDSRALPFAQPVTEVAQVILDVLQHPRADVYSRPQMQQQVVAYYAAEDLGQAERKPPFSPK